LQTNLAILIKKVMRVELFATIPTLHKGTTTNF